MSWEYLSLQFTMLLSVNIVCALLGSRVQRGFLYLGDIGHFSFRHIDSNGPRWLIVNSMVSLVVTDKDGSNCQLVDSDCLPVDSKCRTQYVHLVSVSTETITLLSGVPDLWDRNKILRGGDLSHLHVPDCIWVFFYFVWFVFIHHNFQFYFELCTYCNILDIYLL